MVGQIVENCGYTLAMDRGEPAGLSLTFSAHLGVLPAKLIVRHFVPGGPAILPCQSSQVVLQQSATTD